MEESGYWDVTLTALTYGGDALGRLPDGRAVFVPLALPGERVRVQAVKEKRGHVRARLAEVLQPSPLRITPRCVHFGVCGGCHYQHLAYEDQVVAKTGIVREQLQRLAGLEDPPVLPALVYQRVSTVRDAAYDGAPEFVEARFQIDSWASTRVTARATARAVSAALLGYRGLMGGVAVAIPRQAVDFDSFEEDTRLYRVTAEFIIWHSEE